MLDKTTAQRLLSRLGTMDTEELIETLSLLEELEVRKRVFLAQTDFLALIAAMDATYKFGSQDRKSTRLNSSHT